MRTAGLPANEKQRLQTLERYRLLDTEPEQPFDDLTELAAEVFQVPICLITLVDEQRQWFKSRQGLETAETPRDVAFCAHAILRPEPLVVSDAAEDDRFFDNPLVADAPNIRFYAGAPLVVADNMSLGTLCVIDREPHYPGRRKIRLLEIIRDAVVAQLELRRVTQTTGGLHNLVTMCAWCKNVRLPAEEGSNGEQQRWVSPLESLRDSKVVTHGVCPTCRDRMVLDD